MTETQPSIVVDAATLIWLAGFMASLVAVLAQFIRRYLDAMDTRSDIAMMMLERNRQLGLDWPSHQVTPRPNRPVQPWRVGGKGGGTGDGLAVTLKGTTSGEWPYTPKG